MQVIFIGGCDRSGTTLLGSMLGDELNHICTPESLFKIGLFRNYSPHQKLNRENLREIFKELNKEIFFISWNLKFRMDELIERLNGMTISKIILELVILYGKQSLNKNEPMIWIDHSPDNIKNMPTLLNYYPESRFIHIIRDGRAVIASLMSTDWGPNSILTGCYYWKAQLAHAFLAEKFIDITTIRFEDLLLNPEYSLKKLCSEINLNYSPSFLNAEGIPRPILTSNYHQLIGKKPNKDKIESWRNKLTPREVEIIESSCSDILTNLGYKVDFGINARPSTKKERINFIFQELYSKLGNQISTRNRHRRTKKQLINQDRISS